MDNGTQLKIEQSQKLAITPQLLQSMKMLEMNAAELKDYTDKLYNENPMIDRENRISPAADGGTAAAGNVSQEFDSGLGGRTSSVSDAVTGSRTSSVFDGGTSVSGQSGKRDGNDADENTELYDKNAADATESLSLFVREQIARKRPDASVKAAADYLAEHIDPDGYLDREDIDYLIELGIPEHILDAAVELIQNLEPAGIGARSLKECLLLQLERKRLNAAGFPEFAELIIDEYLEYLDGSAERLAAVMKAPAEKVKAAVIFIKALDPKPCANIGAGAVKEETEYICPDFIITEAEGRLTAELNPAYLPDIFINRHYAEMLEKENDAETRRYLQRKMQQAEWAVSCIEKRKDTLQRFIGLILRHQYDFFDGTADTLAPYTRKEMAAELGMHPSTVGRCINGKYLQCRRGTFPLKYFFSVPAMVSLTGQSSQSIQLALLELIKNEDHAHPLSDRRLGELLAEKGMPISRRTVTKYRERLGVPTMGRRRRK